MQDKFFMTFVSFKALMVYVGFIPLLQNIGFLLGRFPRIGNSVFGRFSVFP